MNIPPRKRAVTKVLLSLIIKLCNVRDTETETERHRGRETERQRDADRETERDRDRDREHYDLTASIETLLHVSPHGAMSSVQGSFFSTCKAHTSTNIVQYE